VSHARPGGAGIDAQALAALGDALDRLGASGLRVVAEAAVLLHAHPQWAVWLRAGGRGWTAMRPTGSMPSGPEVPTVWVCAGTAGELAVMMQRADGALSGSAGV
jgi:hypothetical protein